MWKFWLRHGLVRAPADEGGSGGSGDEGGDAGGGEGDAGGEGGEGGEGGSGEGGSSSILDFATKGDKGNGEGDAGDWKLPDGMELPDHLVGSNADDTLAKVAKAYSGARRELSTRAKESGQLEGSVPESPDGYEITADGDDDKIAAELNSEASKPIVDSFRKAAHELGIPDKAFNDFMRKGMAGLEEAGIPIGVSNEDAARISGEAELETLTETYGKQEAGTIINTLSTYGEKLAARGVLKDESDVEEFGQMVGTARAAAIFHRILTGELGEKPIPPADGMDGSISPQEAQAAYSEASRMKPGAEKDAAMAEAQRKMEKAFGNQPAQTGSVRSSVL